MLSPKPGILDIAAYEGGRAIAPGVADPFKLSANESPLGPSLKAVEAFAAASNGLSVYPEGGAHILCEAIGVAHGLNPDRIVCGNGSGELLAMLAHAYLRGGDEALVTEHGFLLYRIVTFSNGAMPVVAPAGRDLRADVDAMLDRVTSRTRIVFLDNPNNPTGTYLPNSEVRRLHAGLSSDTLLVIDAAYSEYVRRNDYEAGIEMVANFPNVVMTRTFSKIYALAGLRIGWAYCPTDVADALNRVRGPFNVSVPAQLAGVAAMSDRRHVEDSIAHNELWRGWLIENIGKLGLRVDESVANFVLVQFEDAPRATAADLFLMKRGLILRGVGAYGLPHCLRLTVGSEKANLAVVAALSDFQAGAP